MNVLRKFNKIYIFLLLYNITIIASINERAKENSLISYKNTILYIVKYIIYYTSLNI